MLSNLDPFIPQNFPRIAPSDLVPGVHFVPKDFIVDKPFDSIDTSIEAGGESKQFVSQKTTRHPAWPNPYVTIPHSLPKHTPSARGSTSSALTDLPLLIPDNDFVEQIEQIPLITEEMEDTESEAADIFS